MTGSDTAGPRWWTSVEGRPSYRGPAPVPVIPPSSACRQRPPLLTTPQLNKRRGVKFTSFQPAMSREKLVEKSREVRSWRLHRRPNDTLADLARAINPLVRGWMSYWGRFYRTEMDVLLKLINTYLMRWARKKYKRLRGFKRVKKWWDDLLRRSRV